jgi:hypothetical protein
MARSRCFGRSSRNNHDFAYSILKAISGEAYGERDAAAWQAWLAVHG